MADVKGVFFSLLYQSFLNEVDLGMLDENIITQVANNFWIEAKKEAKGGRITNTILDKKIHAATEQLKLLAELETTV